MSVHEDIECQSQYQIRKGSIKGLKNEKAKWQKNLLNPIQDPQRFFVHNRQSFWANSLKLGDFS